MLKFLMNALNDTIGILCLTEKKDNLLMWSHYANSHKGFVLEFNTEHCYFDQRKKNLQLAEHLKKVRYTFNRPEFVLFDTALLTKENMDNWINNFIWVKSDHWSYEEEWRITTTFRGCKKLRVKKLRLRVKIKD
jgi:prenyltransferase beta subunit